MPFSELLIMICIGAGLLLAALIGYIVLRGLIKLAIKILE